VVMNSLGGLLGLSLYAAASKHVGQRKLDACIAVTVLTLLTILLLLRTLVFKVRY
jgi:glycopeptide antibiotics resistance protein